MILGIQTLCDCSSKDDVNVLRVMKQREAWFDMEMLVLVMTTLDPLKRSVFFINVGAGQEGSETDISNEFGDGDEKIPYNSLYIVENPKTVYQYFGYTG